jgi:hypothetical protein
MSASKFKFGRTMNEMIIDDIISDILYNMNIEMFKNEVSNEILEKTVYFKKILTDNTYDYDYSISYLIFRNHLILFSKQLWSQTRKVKPFSWFDLVWL